MELKRVNPQNRPIKERLRWARIMVNGYGIFSDHRKRREEVQDARDAINQALALIDAAEWPGKADYD
jgi:hypothetical protein